MNKFELLKTLIKLVEYANDEGANGLEVRINAPDGGSLNVKFEYEVILPEGYHDN